MKSYQSLISWLTLDIFWIWAIFIKASCKKKWLYFCFKSMSCINKHLVLVINLQYFDCGTNPAGMYFFKVDNGNTRTTCEICLKIMRKTPAWRQWYRTQHSVYLFEKNSVKFDVSFSVTRKSHHSKDQNCFLVLVELE